MVHFASVPWNNMTQQLIWNFAYSKPTEKPLNFAQDQKDTLKWEARFFWPHNEVICLNIIDPGLLDLNLYKKKQKQDDYYLIPKSNFNIKRRHERILYKPLLHQSSIANGFGRKIDLEQSEDYPKDYNPEFLCGLLKQAMSAKIVHVTKESYTYKFDTEPRIKLELARLEVEHKIYYSACIEGKSQSLVESISLALFGKQKSYDYVGFLNTVV
jgi:hypothetical protein